MNMMAITARLLIGAIAFIFCSCQWNDDSSGDEPGIKPVKVTPEIYETNVPIDKVIRLRFDRQLDADTISSHVLHLESGPIGKWLMSSYDPLNRELMVWTSSNMNENVDWRFYITEGIKCLDGTPVAAGDVTTFTTGKTVTGGQPPYKVLSYKDVESQFKKHCLSCHNGADSAFGGLDFTSSQSVKNTLINANSSQWPGWSQVVPYKPGKSYLIFKIIDNDMAAGAQMPLDSDFNDTTKPLPDATQRDISDWIAGGALF